MSDEKKLILEMLSQGKINVTEAEKLLGETEVHQDEAMISKPSNKKFLKVLVAEEGHTKVNINLPIALAEAGLKLIPKEKLMVDGANINLDEILQLVKEGNEGDLVNIEKNDNGKQVKVKVFIG